MEDVQQKEKTAKEKTKVKYVSSSATHIYSPTFFRLELQVEKDTRMKKSIALYPQSLTMRMYTTRTQS